MHEASRDPVAADNEGRSIREAVAANMRRLRLARGLSLRDLSAETGLSKALLSQIERQIANPTVSTLTRIASSLDVTFTELTRAAQVETVVVRAADRSDQETGARMLFSMVERHRFDVSEGFITVGDRGVMSDHGRGSVEYGYVVSGAAELTVDDQTVELAEGDAVQFSAALPHVYRALGRECRILTVVAYADE